jgi:DNA-binding beta-propeller fold protein YncE
MHLKKLPENSRTADQTRIFILSLAVFALPAPSQQLFWSEAEIGGLGRIARSNLDGSGVTTIFMASGIGTIAVDATGASLYFWKDSEAISRMNFDGTNVQQILANIAPRTIALDPTRGKIYWADDPLFSGQIIRRASFDGTGIETIIPEGPFCCIGGIVVDSREEKIYWTYNESDIFGGSVYRSNLDGSAIEGLITVGIAFPLGIAIDFATNKIYFADGNQILRANLDGTDVDTIVSGSKFGSAPSIAINADSRKLYWVDYTEGELRWANLDGTSNELLMRGLGEPYGIAVALPPVFADLVPPGGDRIVEVGDVLCCLDGFSDTALCANADVIPCNGDGNIDVGDILAVLDAFAGIYACVWNNGIWVPN